jgi:2-octaprenyl-6-methoxyphenol hydroxylase
MKREAVDILISGGGVAGLIAAAGFGSAGYSVICVDPTAPITARDSQGADLRTTAFLQPSVAMLEKIGLWQRFSTFATPLKIMRIVDAGGPIAETRIAHDFNSADISDNPFGWNLPNWLLRRELVAHLDSLPNVQFRPGIATTRLTTRQTGALVQLSDGSQITARLLVAADGRASPMRRALGIGVKTIRYGQKALAFAVSHTEPHQNISIETHRTGGPFTLVPLPDHAGAPCSAVVWMEAGPEIARLQSLPDVMFDAAMNQRSCNVLGHLRSVTPRTVWPIISQIADSFYGERTALIAEAAHVVPPIGAQGLNMSLSDLAALLDLATPDSLGSPEMLAAYHRRRWSDVRLRLAGVDMLNRASMIGAQPLRDVRAATLNALYSAAPVRKTLMQLGMGMR